MRIKGVFGTLFLYAIGRGMLDAIARRPGLEVRLARVQYLRALRVVEAARAEYGMAIERAHRIVGRSSRDVKRAQRMYRWGRLKETLQEFRYG